MGGCILRLLSQSWTDTESSVGQQRWLGLIFGVVYYCGRLVRLRERVKNSRCDIPALFCPSKLQDLP